VQKWEIPAASPPAVIAADAGVAEVQPSPDGRRLAVTTGDGRVIVVDVNTGAAETNTALAGAVVKAVTFVGDGVVAAGMERPWLVQLSDPVREIPGTRRMRRLAVLADGQLLGADLVVGMSRWSTLEGAPVREHEDEVFVDLEARPGGRGWVALTAEGRVHLAEGGVPESTFAASPESRQAAAAGALVAVSTRDSVRLLDRNGGLVRELAAAEGELGDVAFSPDAALVAAGGLDGRSRVWDTATGALVAVLTGHAERVSAVEFSPRGDWLATGSWDGTARIWDLTDLRTPAAALAERLAVAPD
jgi:WD40 repeat protein